MCWSPWPESIPLPMVGIGTQKPEAPHLYRPPPPCDPASRGPFLHLESFDGNASLHTLPSTRHGQTRFF